MTQYTAEDLLTEDEVAEILRTPKETLRHWRKNRTGPIAMKFGRRVFYRRGDVGAWLKEKRNEYMDDRWLDVEVDRYYGR